MLPGLLLFLLVQIATACAQFSSNEQENLGYIQDQYLYRNGHIHHRVPLDRTNWNKAVIGNEARERDLEEFYNRNLRVNYENGKQGDAANLEENLIMDQNNKVVGGVSKNDLDDSVKYYRKQLKSRHGMKLLPHNMNYDNDLLTKRRRSKDKARQRHIRDLKQKPSVLEHNGLPIRSYLKPEKKSEGKVTNRNGNSDDNPGELPNFNSDEISMEGVDLTNRMAFIGSSCATGYAKVMTKCVPVY